MIKGLVTVGTTTFNSLIKALDKESSEVELMFQLADGDYLPKHHPYERYIPNIKDIFGNYDFIITHAGAGSVYTLLETNYKFAVIPNTDRSDDHQLELTRFVSENGYAKSFKSSDLSKMKLIELFDLLSEKNSESYSKTGFSKSDEILDFICSKGRQG